MKKKDLHIASPCHENWEAMDARERGRFCNSCEKQVFDLSSMSKDSASALLRENAGKRICVRYNYDNDGALKFKAPEQRLGSAAVVPIGRLTSRRRMAAPAVAAAGLAIAMAACTPHDNGDTPAKPTVTETQKPDFEWRDVLKPFVPEPEPLMGLIEEAPVPEEPCQKEPEAPAEFQHVKGGIAIPDDFDRG